MNRRRMCIVFSLMTLVATALCFVWSWKPEPSSFGLKIVRQAQEQGKQVVFFQVVGPTRPRIQILQFARDNVDEHLGEGAFGGNPSGPPQLRKDFFWGSPEKNWPLKWPYYNHDPYNPALSRKEFGIVAPPNCKVWRMGVTFSQELPLIDRLKAMVSQWRTMRQGGWSLSQTIRQSWTFYGGMEETIRSEAITNASPGGESGAIGENY